MTLYVDEGLFPGYANSFSMTAVSIDKSAVQNMMDNSITYDMSQIKSIFEYFLDVSINDCTSQMREGGEDRYSIAEIRGDYQKALSIIKRMTTADFFNAKMNAQRNGILRNIANCESRLSSGTLNAEGKIQIGVRLSNYRQDLDLWDSLSSDERLFFMAKSMAEYERKNYSYYEAMEKGGVSKASSTFETLLNMSHGKRTMPILMEELVPEIV